MGEGAHWIALRKRLILKFRFLETRNELLVDRVQL
jgi:hypothetical protein